MINKIVFFNHYHRGDLFTHRAFIQELRKELPNILFEYLHYNHPKLTRDLNIPLVGNPDAFSKKERFRIEGKTLYINTWIGCYSKLMKKHGGLNMQSLWEQWAEIYKNISVAVGRQIILNPSREHYTPSVDFSFYNLENIDQYLLQNSSKKILFCNGSPKSNQSFSYNMADFIRQAAVEFPHIHFICTEKFQKDETNIFFTDDIISCTEAEEKRAPWEDRIVNICDLPEISYLSENCDLIVGKNSGPFCFCETKNNYLNPNKSFLSYNVSWGLGNLDSESMSYSLLLKCKYSKVLIESVDLTDNDKLNIVTSLRTAIEQL
jgi:hypothetical protein